MNCGEVKNMAVSLGSSEVDIFDIEKIFFCLRWQCDFKISSLTVWQCLFFFGLLQVTRKDTSDEDEVRKSDSNPYCWVAFIGCSNTKTLFLKSFWLSYLLYFLVAYSLLLTSTIESSFYSIYHWKCSEMGSRQQCFHFLNDIEHQKGLNFTQNLT